MMVRLAATLFVVVVVVVTVVECTELSPDAENTCLRTEKFQEVVMVYADIEKYKMEVKWCWAPKNMFRCTKRIPVTERVKQPKTVERSRLVLDCCTGYEKRDGKCEPQCQCSHGDCTAPDVCQCHSGYYGVTCEKECPTGRWGRNCSEKCDCLRNEECEPINGKCICNDGWYGYRCEVPCPEGFYGKNCREVCDCQYRFCHPETGACYFTLTEPPVNRTDAPADPLEILEKTPNVKFIVDYETHPNEDPEPSEPVLSKEEQEEKNGDDEVIVAERVPEAGTQDRLKTVTNVQDGTKTVIETEDRWRTVTQTQDSTKTAIETDDRWRTATGAQDRMKMVTEPKDNMKTTIETEDRWRMVTEAQEGMKSVIETEDRWRTVTESQNRMKTVTEAQDRMNPVIATEDRWRTVTENQAESSEPTLVTTSPTPEGTDPSMPRQTVSGSVSSPTWTSAIGLSFNGFPKETTTTTTDSAYESYPTITSEPEPRVTPEIDRARTGETVSIPDDSSDTTESSSVLPTDAFPEMTVHKTADVTDVHDGLYEMDTTTTPGTATLTNGNFESEEKTVPPTPQGPIYYDSDDGNNLVDVDSFTSNEKIDLVFEPETVGKDEEGKDKEETITETIKQYTEETTDTFHTDTKGTAFTTRNHHHHSHSPTEPSQKELDIRKTISNDRHGRVFAGTVVETTNEPTRGVSVGRTGTQPGPSPGPTGRSTGHREDGVTRSITVDTVECGSEVPDVESANLTLLRFIPSLSVLSGASILIVIIGARWLVLRHQRKIKKMTEREKVEMFHAREREKYQESFLVVTGFPQNPMYIYELNRIRDEVPVLETFKPPPDQKL